MKITLCIDKQSRDNPSSELRQYLIDIGCPLRSYEGVFDELKISTDDTNKLVGVIIRRCYVDKYGVLKKLDKEELQTLEISEITLFEGTNYVYIQEFTNLNMKIEYLTNAEMNKYFATKAEMNSSIKQTYDSIMLSVSEKADANEVSVMIKLLSKEIALKVAKDDVVNELNISDELIAIIGNRLKIETDNFKLTETGNMTCNDAVMNDATMKKVNIVDGNILINDTSDSNNSHLTIKNGNVVGNYGSNFVYLKNEKNNCSARIDTQMNGTFGYFSLSQYDYLDEYHNTVGYRGIDINLSSESPSFIFSTDNSNTVRFTKTQAYFDLPVYANSYNNNSLESKKKNFESFNKGLELITSSDFYLYNLKSEDDNDKKHIGLVIGDKYNTPVEFINKNGDAIDLYSLISACGDAIKTLNNRVIELEKQIKEMR